MKKLLRLFILSALISGLSFAGVMNVTSPTAGVGFCTGDTVNIVWHETPKDHADVKIRLFDHTVTTQILPINNSTPNDGSYNWIIPANIPPGQYVIRVRTLDNQETDDSGIFTISNCSQPAGSIDVTKPGASFSTNSGGACLIVWNSTGTVGGPLKIGLYNSNGTSFIRSINNNVSINGNFNWTVPNDVPVGNYKVKVQTLDESIKGVSETFSISNIITTFRPVEMQASFIKTPDLQISIFFHGDPPNVNEETLIEFRVKNIGKATSSPTKMRAFMGGTPTDTWDVKALGPGRFMYKTKRLKPAGVGWILWTANVDQTGDANQENNRVSKKMFVKGSDLKITNVNTPDYKKTIQQKCTMNVTVTNIGHADSGRFEIDCDMDTCPLIAQGRKFRVHPGLAPGKSATFQFTHRYACFKMVGVDFYVDKNNQVKEENEKNNECGLPFHISGGNIGKKKSPWSSNCN